MNQRWITLGWILAGVIIGVVLTPLMVFWRDVSFDLKLSVVGLAQLAATIFLALYIPLAIERYRDRLRSTKSMLLDEIAGFMTVARSINAGLTAAAQAGTTTQQDLMKIRTGFMTANARLARLDQQFTKEHPKSCTRPLAVFRGAYENYWKAVTGGALYAGSAVDWKLWRQQEFAFSSMELAASELTRFLNTR